MAGPKIIILTPVKDEEWILERFLVAACEVADHVLVLDQQSEDNSRAICAKFPKVVVIDNLSGDYSEVARSRLLLEGARDRFGAGNVLVALDADEILTGNSLKSASWEILRTLPPGTVIHIEKPEMLPHPARCIRQKNWFPLGLVDNGAPHEGTIIHSHRVPVRSEAPCYYSADLCVMHFARLRPLEFAVRQAFYCMVENVNRSKTHRVRNCFYSPRLFLNFGAGEAQPCPPEWFAWFDARGIDLWSYQTVRFNSFHRRALLLFAKHGAKRFRWDDIWWEDWEAARRFFVAKNIPGIPDRPLQKPSAVVRFVTLQLIRFYVLNSKLATLFRRLVNPPCNPRIHG